MDQVRVTVLITTYNYARYLPRSIDSALHQEYAGPPVEILVIDDGSSDDTAAVVQQYGERIRYIAKPNGGQASAINLGVQEANGDILCLLDGDDYFYPGKVQAVAEVFARRPGVGLVYDEFDIVDRDGRSLDKQRPEPTWSGYRIPLSRVPGQLRSLIVLGHPWTCITSAMSVRRRVVTELRVPDDRFRHSPDLFLGLVLPFMTDVAIVESPQTAYVYHGDNVGLFRSSAENRALYARQMECIRHVIEERFAVSVPAYGGRGIYGPGPGGDRGARRPATYLRELRLIARADVEPALKRRSLAKLAASALLPQRAYRRLQELREHYYAWRSREYRRRIEAAGRKERVSD
jgi:glycosyltransferase involved in cell wall biosynthesis